jgi:hypothetical protein
MKERNLTEVGFRFAYGQVSTKIQKTFDSESLAQAAGYCKAGNCK